MATISASHWAYFLKKLGCTHSKASIMKYAASASDNEVWNKYIASSPLALKACKANKITCPDDIRLVLEHISYSHMRSSYPTKSHGRSIIGPKIIPMSAVGKTVFTESDRESNIPQESSANFSQELQRNRIEIPENIVGKRINHTTFGEGTITKTRDATYIIVQFDKDKERVLSYDMCIKNGFFIFI